MYIRFICLCFFLLFLAIVPLSTASAKPTPAPLAPQTFKIAAEWALPPFSYVAEKGAMTGASIDIMEKIAAYNHVTFQYVPMNLSEAERELRAGHIDAIAGLSYSTEKSKRFDFSDSYFTMSDALIVPIAQKNVIQTVSDVRNAHVALQNRESVVGLLLNLRHSNLIVTSNQLSGLQALLTGRADVFIGNKWTANVYLQQFKQQQNFIIQEDVIEPSDFAIAVRKGDTALLPMINRTLTTMKAKGELNELLTRWLHPGSAVQITRLQEFVRLLILILVTTGCILLFIYIWNYRLKRAVQERTEELLTVNTHLQEERQQVANRDAFKDQILNTIYTGIVTFDLNFSITSYNSRAEEILRSAVDSSLPLSHSSLLARILSHQKDIEERSHISEKGESPTKLEIEENGEWKVIYYRLITLYDAQQQQTGYLVAMTDRTEEKRLEQKLIVQEKLHALGQLVAGVAHEIRNPLTSIKMFVDMLPNKYDQPQFREAILEHLPPEIDRLNMIVTDLLNYARPRSPSREAYTASALLASLLTLLRVVMEKNQIVLEQVVQDDLTFYIDPQQIRQVFLNLLLNSIDAMETQSVKKITITVAKETETNGRVSITDTGIGITSEQMKRIFEPFYTRKPNGVGLGLPLSYKLIKENDGEMHVLSQPDEGTTVIVLLPLHRSEETDCAS